MIGDSASSHEARDRLYEIIRSSVSFEDKARQALELGRDYLDADYGYLTRIDTETDHWETIVSTDPPDGEIPEGMEADLGTTYCRRTMTANDQIALHDLPNQGWDDDIAFETYGLHCYLGTRIILDEEPYGTVCFAAEDARSEPFTDGETMFAELISRLLERELEREQHETELTRHTNLALVLNRILRHNLRNDMAVIRGFTQLMTERLNGDVSGEIALRNIDKLIQLAEKARELDEIIASNHERMPTAVVSLVEEVVDSVREDYPNATVTIEADHETTTALYPSFERALWELLENAAKHSGTNPQITVSVETVPNAIEIHIEDTGPGLSEQEVAVLESGVETPLTHGSGLGLWLTHWIVSNHDGEITPEASDAGTSMTLSIPRKATPTTETLAKLTRARDQYQAAFEESNDGMVIVNDDARVVDANPATEHVYGLDRQTLLGRKLSEFIPEGDDFDTVWSEFQRADIDRDTKPVAGGDGVTRQIEYSAVRDIVPGQHLIIGRNVTDRVQQENQLRLKTQAMAEAPIGITITDPTQPDNPMVYTNKQFRRLTGYDDAEILGRNCRFLQGEKTDPETVATIRRGIDAEEPVSVRIRNYRKDGTLFWNRISIAPVRDDHGTVTNWIGFQEDVTDQVRREQELESATERLEKMIEVSPDPIIMLDADGKIKLWNTAAEAVFGYDASSVVGQRIQNLKLHSDDQTPEFETQLKRVLAGNRLKNYEIDRHTEHAEHVRLSLSAAPIQNESETIVGVIAVAKDITDHV